MLIYKPRRLTAMLVFRARFIHVLSGVVSYALVTCLLLYFAGEPHWLAGEHFANRIVIDTPGDDVILATALFCQEASPDSHKTVYFQDDSLAALLGVKPLGSDEIALNPYGISVAKGDVLYYIAPHRLSEEQCFSSTSA